MSAGSSKAVRARETVYTRLFLPVLVASVFDMGRRLQRSRVQAGGPPRRRLAPQQHPPRLVEGKGAAAAEGVRVVQGDVLTVRLPNEPFVVVANIPFNATTSILHRLLDDPTTPLRSAHLLVQKQVALKHARCTPTTLKTLDWSPWYAFSAGLELPASVFHPQPEVDACLVVAVKRGPPLVAPEHRHFFRAFMRRVFDGHGNCVGETLRPFFTKPQLRRLARDNEFSLGFSPSMLTAHQWASVFDSMIRLDWGGLRADARVQKYPATQVAVSCHIHRRWYATRGAHMCSGWRR